MSVLLYARLIQVDQPRSVIQYYTFNNLRTSGFISAIPFDHGNVNFGGFPIPQKFSDALLLSAHLQQKVEEQEAKIEEDKPKVEYYSGMVENRDYFTTTTIATELRTTSQVLNQFLCKKGVLTGKSGSWKVTDEHQTLLSPSPFKSIIRWNHEGRTLIHQLWEERVEELLANHGGQYVAAFQVEIVVGAVEVGGHDGDVVRTVLQVEAFAHLQPGNLGNGIRLVGVFQR